MTSGEKITVTTRFNSSGVERVLLSVAGKAGKYIIDMGIDLNDEEVALLSASLSEALSSLRKQVSND